RRSDATPSEAPADQPLAILPDGLTSPTRTVIALLPQQLLLALQRLHEGLATNALCSGASTSAAPKPEGQARGALWSLSFWHSQAKSLCTARRM
ncbi:MAG: hypothetical protein WAM94_05955, partial [Chromatiaceae bacterium]